MNNEFAPILNDEMKRCCENKDYDPLDKVQNQVEEVKKIMINNVDGLLEREKRINELAQEAQRIEDSVRKSNSLKIKL
jgi:hypothetical protein